MRKRRTVSRVIVALLCAFALVTADAAPAVAVTMQEINNLKNSADGLDKQKKDLERQIQALQNDRSQVLKRKSLLDDQITNIGQRIANVEEQIADYEELIRQAEADLAQAEADEAEQYALFCRRVRAMEKQGKVNYWSVLFRATSFSDLLGRLDIINEIMDADQRIIDGLKDLQVRVKERKSELEESKAGCEDAKLELVCQQEELENKRAEANQLIKQLAANEKDLHAHLEEAEEEEKRIEAEIKRLQKEWEAQQAALGFSAGGYIWPTTSRYITSTVGGRTSPGGIGSTNHKGTDIGRVGYTSPVYASKAGTVLISAKSSSYGNYIVISHGAGNTTLYGHLSSRKVNAGDKVKQGQVIGVTGSTGNSTGPHLHFEIQEKNEIINPLSHGAEPRKAYLTGYTLSESA